MFLEPSIRARRDGLLLLLYVLSYDTWPRKTGAGCAALLGLWVRARVDRQLAVGWLRRGTATAFAHRGCIRSPTHRSLLVLLRVPRIAAVPGSAQLDFYLIKDRCHFSIGESDGPSRQIFGHRILKSDVIPSDLQHRTA